MLPFGGGCEGVLRGGVKFVKVWVGQQMTLGWSALAPMTAWRRMPSKAPLRHAIWVIILEQGKCHPL